MNRHERRHQGALPPPPQPDPKEVEKLQKKLEALESLHTRFPALRPVVDFDDFYAVTDQGELDFEWTLKDYKNNDAERGEVKLVAMPPSFHKLPDGSVIQRVTSFYDVTEGVFFTQCGREQRQFIEKCREAVVQGPEE